MSVAKRLTIENVDLDDESEINTFDDQVITSGLERVRAEGDELRRRGILDSEGNLLVKELPADMIEGADRDYYMHLGGPARIWRSGGAIWPNAAAD